MGKWITAGICGALAVAGIIVSVVATDTATQYIGGGGAVAALALGLVSLRSKLG